MRTLEVVRLAAYVYARYFRIDAPTLSTFLSWMFDLLSETVASLQNRSQFHQEHEKLEGSACQRYHSWGCCHGLITVQDFKKTKMVLSGIGGSDDCGGKGLSKIRY